jgi:hypothetical protein
MKELTCESLQEYAKEEYPEFKWEVYKVLAPTIQDDFRNVLAIHDQWIIVVSSTFPYDTIKPVMANRFDIELTTKKYSWQLFKDQIDIMAEIFEEQDDLNKGNK